MSRNGHKAYWTILYKKTNEPHEFFTAKKCTKSQAWIQFERAIPKKDRGRSLHIHEEGTFNFFDIIPDHTVTEGYDKQISIYT